VSKSGAEKLQNLIEEYKTLKELDPQDSILKRVRCSSKNTC
jgi:hypothetical protein